MSKDLDQIIKNVCYYFGEKKDDLIQPKGNGSGISKLNKIRQVIVFIAYNDFNYTLAEIGDKLLRNHSTIINSKKKATNYYNLYESYKTDINKCRYILSKSRNNIAKEIYKRHYLEKFEYLYENKFKMAQHLKQIAVDAIDEALIKNNKK